MSDAIRTKNRTIEKEILEFHSAKNQLKKKWHDLANDEMMVFFSPYEVVTVFCSLDKKRMRQGSLPGLRRDYDD